MNGNGFQLFGLDTREVQTFEQAGQNFQARAGGSAFLQL
jgi:hypothetical protein